MKTHLNMPLDEKETAALNAGKMSIGIKSNTEYVRYLIMQSGGNQSSDPHVISKYKVTADPSTCKACGTYDHMAINEGKGNHAYKSECGHCGGFQKWLSRYDVETYTHDYIINRYHGLIEHVAELEGKAPYKQYVAEQKELERIESYAKEHGIEL